jgi:flagellar hook-associated protein 2
MDATFRAGGLMSGLDTNLIIDKLTDLQRRPISLLAAKKKAFEVQLSGLATLTSRLTQLQDRFSSVAKAGALGMLAETSAAGFSATASPQSSESTYSVRVQQLATAAKARSAAFTGPDQELPAGNLAITVDGQAYEIEVEGGDSLATLAERLNGLGAPFSASLINDGASTFLMLTNKTTGFAIGEAPGSALSIVETPTNPLGPSMLGLNVVVEAKNAIVELDGLTVERRSNTVADAIPGTTLSLKQETAGSETLVISQSKADTKAKLQELVDAYNSVMSVIQGDLKIGANIDRSRTLAGDSSVRMLQRSLQSVITAEVPGVTGARTLGDLGVRTQRDGSLSIDDRFLDRVLAQNPGAIDAILGGENGVVAAVTTVVRFATESSTGTLTQRQSGINQSIRRLEQDSEAMEMRVTSFRDGLIKRFMAMEESVGKMRNIGNFLESVKFPGFTRGGDS